jgi:predicted transcriptional regulator
MQIKDKKYVKVISRTKANPLKLHAMIVYSYLVSKYGNKKTYTQRWLSRTLNISRKAFTGIKAALTDARLLGIYNGRWHALKPDETAITWFVPWTAGPPFWYKRFAYWKLYLHSEQNTLSRNEGAVLSLMLSLNMNRTEKGLATILGLDRRTVHNCIEKLISLGLIQRTTMGVIVKYHGKDDWYIDKYRTKAASNTDAQLAAVLQGKTDRFKSFGIDLSTEGYTTEEIQQVWSYANEGCFIGTAELREIHRLACLQHRANSSKYVGMTSAALFLSKLKSRSERARAQEAAMKKCNVAQF